MSGYHFLFVPGPSNVPAAVQQAIHCPMEDHRNPTIPDLIQPITQDLKKILRTETGKVVFFPSSGTGCWEAALQSTLNVGDKVLIERAGDVIPKVLRITKKVNTKRFKIPTVCHSCGKADIHKEGSYMFCKNTECPEILNAKLAYLVSKKSFNIIGLGKQILINLVENNVIKDIADVFSLDANNLIQLDGFGEKLAKNLVDEINLKKEVDFDKFINSLGIRHVGENVSKIIAENFNSLDELIHTDSERIENLDGIGTEIAKSIMEFVTNRNNIDIIRKILSNGVEIKYTKNIIGEKLRGNAFCITGTLKNFTRNQLIETIRQEGGIAVSTVNKKTNYLIVGDNPGSKLNKANELDIDVIDENEFLKLIKK